MWNGKDGLFESYVSLRIYGKGLVPQEIAAVNGPLLVSDLPAGQSSFQTSQIRFVRPYVWEISDELFEGRNFAPGGHGENFNHSFALDSQIARAPFKTASQYFGPILGRSGRLHIVTPNPGQPLRNLRLVAPAHPADVGKCLFNIDDEVAGVRAGHVAIVNVQDDRHFARFGFRFVGGKLRREGVRDIDHVSDSAHRLRHCDVVNVNARKRSAGTGGQNT